MKRFYNFSSKLMLFFIVSVFIPMIIGLIFLFNYFTGVLSKQNMIAYENTLQSVANNIDTYLDDLKRLTLSPYMYDEIYNYMSYLNTNLNIQSNNIEAYNLSKSYSSILNKLINTSRKDILAITFIPINNTSTSYVVNKHYYTLCEMESLSEYKDWINSTLQSTDGVYFTPLHNISYPSSKDKYKVFSLMRVVKNPYTKKVIGLIKVDAEEYTIKNIITSIDTSENSKLLLVDDSKDLIYSTSQVPDSVESLSEYNVLEKEINSNNWTLIYLDSKINLYIKTLVMLIVFILIGLLFLLFAALFFKIRIKDIINSIYKIASSMEKLENGQQIIDSNISGTYEFELISNAINKIAININTQTKKEYEAVIKQKKAEYIALQSQINPHFLNNILSGFVTLNRINEKQLLEDSIIQLSQFYRYTCNNSTISTLQEEFNCIEKYLTLEKLRFDDLIEFELYLCDEAKDLKLPKLILQPLVENCIKHGFKTTHEPIFINVSSNIQVINKSTYLIIDVSDNGDGFDMKNTNFDKSVGLKNIKDRLTIFENNSEFTIESIPRVLTKSTIKLPIKED